MDKLGLVLLSVVVLAGCSGLNTRTVVTLDDGTRVQTAIVTGAKANTKIKFKDGGEAEINQIGKSIFEKLKGVLPSPVKVEQ